MKAVCIKHLQEYVASFQERRAKVTDEIVDDFMAQKPLTTRVQRIVPVLDSSATPAAGAEATEAGDGKLTKNQLKKLEKEKQIAAKKAAKAAEKEATKASS
jgi:tryptophanyl-tRNA synthetase